MYGSSGALKYLYLNIYFEETKDNPWCPLLLEIVYCTVNIFHFTLELSKLLVLGCSPKGGGESLRPSQSKAGFVLLPQRCVVFIPELGNCLGLHSENNYSNCS